MKGWSQVPIGEKQRKTGIGGKVCRSWQCDLKGRGLGRRRRRRRRRIFILWLSFSPTPKVNRNNRI